MWREGIEQFADTLPCRFDGSFGGFSQQQFELGEHLFDGIEVGAVGRKVEQLCACRPDRGAHGLALVAAEVVHDDDVARCQRRYEELGDVGCEALAIDRAVEHTGRVDPVVAEGGKERQRPPFAERGVRDERLAARCPAPDRRHVRLGPGFVDEDEPFGIKPPLILLPLGSPPCDRRTGLLLGEQAFF